MTTTFRIDQINRRRVGEYGTFVAPLEQLLDDASAFLEIDVRRFADEVQSIDRHDMGVHPEEAAILYALTRALRPDVIVETGTFKGFSTAEIARALRANGAGRITTIDIASDSGEMVPRELRDLVTFERGEPSWKIARRLRSESARIDLFFHDSLHTYTNALQEIVEFSPCFAPGCVVLCHDAKMDVLDDFGVGRAVRRIATSVGVEYRILDSTCGLAMMRWPAQTTPAQNAALVSEYEKAKRSEVMHARVNRVLSWFR